MDSRFITTALSGTSNDRKTTIRSRNDRPSTAAKNHGSRAARYSVKSTPMATPPATATSSPVPSVVGGRMSDRKRLTRSVVSASCGAVVGITRHSAAVSPSLEMGGLTNATPGSAWMASDTACRAAGSVPSGTSLASTRVPLKPGPNPSASRS